MPRKIFKVFASILSTLALDVGLAAAQVSTQKEVVENSRANVPAPPLGGRR